MLTQDYLNLGLVRLRPAEQWRAKGEGISFIFPRAGSGLCLKAAARLSLAPGDVLVTPADPTAHVTPADGAEFAFWHFSLRLEHLYPLFAGTEISLLRSIIDDLKASRFYPASSILAIECHKLIGDIPPQFNLDHRGQLIRLAAAILNNEFKTARGRRVGYVRPEDHLIQVFEKLSTEEMLNHSVEELAERFGCSRRHLSRLFHHYFGYSVGALRMEMRLLKAISLLRDHDAKIIHVAEQCGFNHLGLFNTCFRKRFGTSPGRWRKTVSQEIDNSSKTTGHEIHEVGAHPGGPGGRPPGHLQSPISYLRSPISVPNAPSTQPEPKAAPASNRARGRAPQKPTTGKPAAGHPATGHPAAGHPAAKPEITVIAAQPRKDGRSLTIQLRERPLSNQART